MWDIDLKRYCYKFYLFEFSKILLVDKVIGF